MQIHAVIPVKSLDQAKSRLAGMLQRSERRALVLQMLERVLGTLLTCRGTALAEVWVLSADHEVWALTVRHGARVLHDYAGALNGALDQARHTLESIGAEGMLIIPADVPLISAGDVATLAEQLASGADVALAPDQQGAGTNALGLRLPSALPFAFGEQSSHLHRQSAGALGLSVAIYRSPGLGLDIDTPASLRRYRAVEATSTDRAVSQR